MTPEREREIRDMVRYTGRHGTPWRTTAEDLLAEVDRLRAALEKAEADAAEARRGYDRVTAVLEGGVIAEPQGWPRRVEGGGTIRWYIGDECLLAVSMRVYYRGGHVHAKDCPCPALVHSPAFREVWELVHKDVEKT
jgi:hypothetical protein